jgi:hypothetical protein
LTSAIIDHDRHIVGDGIMALSNAPLTDCDHSDNASAVTLEMYEDLKRLN